MKVIVWRQFHNHKHPKCHKCHQDKELNLCVLKVDDMYIYNYSFFLQYNLRFHYSWFGVLSLQIYKNIDGSYILLLPKRTRGGKTDIYLSYYHNLTC